MTVPIDPLTEMIAFRDIQQLKARRDRFLDQKDWDAYADLHAPDHESAHDGFPSWVGRDTLIEQTRTIMTGVDTVHHSHTPDITLTSPTAANAIWYLEDQLFWTQDDTEHAVRGFGFYHERCEKRGDAWVFTYRRLERTLLIATPGAEHPAVASARASGILRTLG